MKRTRDPVRALGISPHTGWAACVVVAGTPKKPEIIANQLVDVLGDDERFCFHMAADMKRADAAKLIARIRRKALANAKKALAPLLEGVSVCAIVAKPGDPGDLDHILAAHPRLHTAEGCLYRDAFAAAASPLRVVLVPPKSLDANAIGKIVPPPWGRDQRLAALAAWSTISS